MFSVVVSDSRLHFHIKDIKGTEIQILNANDFEQLEGKLKFHNINRCKYY